MAYDELELRDAKLDATDERARLANLERDAAAMGMPGEPVFEPVLFALPPATAQVTPAYRILELSRIRADALVDRERVFGVVRSVELAGRYESATDRYQLDAVVGLNGGRPSLGAGLEYRPQQDDQWTVGLTARIGFGDQVQSSIGIAERRAVGANAELEAYVAAFPRAAAEELRLAEVARERLEIPREIHRTRTQELAAVQARGADTTRLERNIARDFDRMYLAWLRYVEEVDDYLELVGADWQIVGTLE
jgi:signal transduction histidine kinase